MDEREAMDRVMHILAEARSEEIDRLRRMPMDELTRGAVIREVEASMRNAEHGVRLRMEEWIGG